MARNIAYLVGGLIVGVGLSSAGAAPKHEDLPVSVQKYIKGGVKDLDKAAKIVEEHCGAKIAYQVDEQSWPKELWPERPGGLIQHYASMYGHCSAVFAGVNSACQGDKDVSAALPKRLKKVVCKHDPDVKKKLKKQGRYEGPSLALKDGVLTVGFLKLPSSNIQWEVYQWLSRNL